LLEDIRHLQQCKDEAQLAAVMLPVQACAHNHLRGTLQDLFMMDKCPVPAALVGQLDNGIRGLLADATACARIVTIPLPLAYIVHLR
jgi:predicted membrane chloride channel (bestrophin family)